MDRNTLQTYGMVLVTLLIISTLLLVFTPLGEKVMNAIEITANEFMNRTEIENSNPEREEAERNPEAHNITKTVTVNFLFNNGQIASPTIKKELKYGNKIDISTLMPANMDGYEPDYIPGEQTVTRDIEYTITFSPKQYQINYKLDGGTIVSSRPNTYVYGQTTNLPTKVIKEGKFFAGWYSNSAGTGARITEINPSQKGDITLFARWESSKYKIKYMSDGVDITNTISGAIKEVVYGSKPIDLPILSTKADSNGYPVYFAGWYTNELFEGAPKNYTPQYPDRNITYYAKWSTRGFNIAFVTNGGEFLGSRPSSYITSYGLKLPTNIVRTGCEFNGWYNNKDFDGEKIEEIKKSESGDKSFFAKWTPKTYTIDYDTNGGTIVGNIPRNHTYFNKAEKPAINGVSVKLPTTVHKEGYDFIGWKDENTEEIVTDIKEGTARNVYLIAQFEKKAYRLTFNANGGYFGDKDKHIETQHKNILFNNQFGTFPDNPERDGFVFAGWFTDRKGGKPVTELSVLTKNSDIEVYARWLGKEYNIIYKTNGGNFERTPVDKFQFGENVDLPQDIKKDSFTFSGWYLDETFKTPIKTINANTNHNVTVYAKWIPKTYTITYDMAGGFINGNVPSQYTYGDTVKLPTPEKWGCQFRGWKDTGTGKIKFDIKNNESGNKKYIAIWGTTGTNVVFNLVDKDGNILNSEKNSIIMEDIQINETYVIDSNYIVDRLGISDIYYHAKTSIIIDKNTPKTDGRYQFNITAYPYRRFHVSAESLKTGEPLNVYNNIYKFKQNQDSLAEADKSIKELHENIDMKDIKIFGENKNYVFANKISIDGKKYSCTSPAYAINNILEKYLPYTDKEVNVVYYYDSNAFELKFYDAEDPSFRPNVIKPDDFPTTYYSSEGLLIPEITRQCYQFTGWIAKTSDGTAIELENGNTIPTGTKGTVTLKSTWKIKPDDDAAHNYKVIVETTCTKDGLKKCTHCGKEVSEKAFGHDWSNPIFEPFTGVISGYIKGQGYSTAIFGVEYHRTNCKRCSSAYLVEKHQYSDWSYNTDADHGHHCSICSYSEYKEHSMLYKFLNDDIHLAACNVCGWKENQKHDMVYTYQNANVHSCRCKQCGAFVNEHSTRPHEYIQENGYWYCALCDKNREHPLIKATDGTFKEA